VRAGNDKVVAAMLKHSKKPVDAGIKDKRGQTALDLAKESECALSLGCVAALPLLGVRALLLSLSQLLRVRVAFAVMPRSRCFSCPSDRCSCPR
jgi:hypothetical protein